MTNSEILSAANPSSAAPSVTNQHDASKGNHKRGRRTATLLVLASLVGVGIVGRWLHYRYRHVISSDAMVKGKIAQVGARIEGRVGELLVEENQRVRKGDLLVKLEDHFQQAKLARAKADHERTQRELAVEQVSIESDRLLLGVQLAQTRSQVGVFEAERHAAENEVQRWKRQDDRIKSVSMPLVVTAAEVDLVSTSLGTAKATVEAAEARVKSANLTADAAQASLNALKVREARLDVLRGFVSAAEADVAAATADLDATMIRAPEDGCVSQRLIEAGGSVRVGYPVISLWIGDRVWIEAWVDESRLADLEIGSQVDVRLAAYSNHVIEGRVQAIGALAEGAFIDQRDVVMRDPNLLLPPRFSVRIALPQNDLRVMPGLSATVGIGLGTSLFDQGLVYSDQDLIKVAKED